MMWNIVVHVCLQFVFSFVGLKCLMIPPMGDCQEALELKKRCLSRIEFIPHEFDGPGWLL